MVGNHRSPTGLARRAARWARRKVRGRQPQPAILMYHRVAKETFDPWDLAVPPAVFRQQVQWVAAHRTVLPLAEFARLHRAGRLPANAVAITFDDAYACVAQVAAPILQEASVAATVFVPAELIGRNQEFWWDDLQRIVLETSAVEFTLDDHRFVLGERCGTDGRWHPYDGPATKRQRAFHTLWSRLRTKAPADISKAMGILRTQSKVDGSPRSSHRAMTPAEMKALQPSTIEFGSHALTHPSLPCLTTEEKRHEIIGSVERCAALTGHRPTTMAYPYGDFDLETEQLAAEAGFDCACTTEQAFVTARSRPTALPRIQIGSWDTVRLAQALQQ